MKIILKKEIGGSILFSCSVSKCEVKSGRLFLKGFFFDFDSYDWDGKEAVFYLKKTKETLKNLQKILKR